MKSSFPFFIKRTLMMLTGILFICICVGCYRLSGFGVDAFTCMNLGISGYLNMLFGTWQLIMNAVILVIVFFTVRHCIGAGTIVNMVCVGYGADFICWMAKDICHLEMTLTLRIIALILGCLFAGLGVAFYMVAEMESLLMTVLHSLLKKQQREGFPFNMPESSVT